MPQPASTAKIEELRFRVKSDPKSRLFFPLAEELRKIDQLAEAENVLRAGLGHHPAYLSAWVSLGRVLREQDKHAAAVEALNKALQVDPGNVVAARLLADAYLDLGDKLEAIKKYKLVRALLPADDTLDVVIERLEDELNPVTLFQAPGEDTLRGSTLKGGRPLAEAEATMPAEGTRDAEPMSVAHSHSPFEEPAPDYSAAALEVEQPPGIHIESAPPAAEVTAPRWPEEEPASDVFAPVEASGDLTNTITMAELYVRQGFVDKAREIYVSILQRDPDNRDVRQKLDALAPSRARNPKVDKLERWLTKVTKREEGSVV
jgi:tetratricopeptide (TPR) repeat protein